MTAQSLSWVPQGCAGAPPSLVPFGDLPGLRALFLASLSPQVFPGSVSSASGRHVASYWACALVFVPSVCLAFTAHVHGRRPAPCTAPAPGRGVSPSLLVAPPVIPALGSLGEWEARPSWPSGTRVPLADAAVPWGGCEAVAS